MLWLYSIFQTTKNDINDRKETISKLDLSLEFKILKHLRYANALFNAQTIK